MIRKLHRASDPELDAQLDLILKHGHDDKYSLLNHLHDERYELKCKTGWIPGEQVGYVAANKIKIIGLDWRDRIKQGTKIRYKQGGDWKYDFVSEITANTDTTLTLLGGSTVENEAITEFWFSNIATPLGWPFGVDYIEGTNANGTWKKYVDGTAECYGTKIFSSVVITTMWGNGIYLSPSMTITLPLDFVDMKRSGNVNILSRSPNVFVPLNVEALGTHTIYFYFWRSASYTFDTITVGFSAKGRWK